MNVDVTEQSPQQAVQNPQQALQEQEKPQLQQEQEKPTVVALLISPSSASSPTSTVSPTASSISKNSSTDEVDETTAEAADHPQSSEPTGKQQREAVVVQRSQVVEQKAVEIGGVHQQQDVAGEQDIKLRRQAEHYQRSSTEECVASSIASAKDDDTEDATMTYASVSCDRILDSTTTDGALPGQRVCAIEEPVVEIATSATASAVTVVAEEEIRLNSTTPSVEEIENQTTTTDAGAQQDHGQSKATSSCSSSSGMGKEPVQGNESAPLASVVGIDTLPTASVLAAANNNPMPDEDNEDEQEVDSSSSSSSSSSNSSTSSTSSISCPNGSSSSSSNDGCSDSSGSNGRLNRNDRFNNNNNNNNNSTVADETRKAEGGDGSGGKVKVSGTAAGGNDSLPAAGLAKVEEGVRTSAATEIAPKAEGAEGNSRRVTLPNVERSTDGVVLVTHDPPAPAAPALERVQILPAQHETDANVYHDDDEEEEGVGLTSTAVTTPPLVVEGGVSEENNTISNAGGSGSSSSSSSSAIVVVVCGSDGGGGGEESSSLPSTPSASVGASTSSSAAILSSSRSTSPTSSSESSPPGALAEAQPPPRPEAAAAVRSAVDRQLYDSARKGHSFVVVAVEGQHTKSGGIHEEVPHATATVTGGGPFSSAPMKNPTTSSSTHLAVVNEDDDGSVEGCDSSRPLTLAEELSQADAFSSVSSGTAAPSAPGTSGSTADRASTVAAALPTSAADTTAAATVVASSRSTSSRSTSPILHSSLKKSYRRMGVMTGAAVTEGVAAVAAASAGTVSNETRRRVSFPKDAQLITGYLDPVNPWACISICEASELVELYKSSCKRHCTLPLKSVMDHLRSIDISKGRVPLLCLKDQQLSYGACEALEEIFKHVQYRCIDLSHSGLDDVTASVMFDIIEYYEAANELDISDNLQMSSKSWTACINMLKKSQALNVLVTRGPTISDYQATNLAKALNTSAIHTLKLEHCVLSQQPIASLCSILKRNTVLRELWLAHNQLSCEDAQQIANLLRTNFYIQLIDISNNRIGDKGVEHIVTAIVEQSVYFKDMQEKKRKSDLNFADLSSSLNSINNGVKHYFPQRLTRASDPLIPMAADQPLVATDDDTLRHCSPSAITLTPPVTPPSTPALPAVETPTADTAPPDLGLLGEKEQERGKTGTNMYTINQQHAQANDAPAAAPPAPPTPPADPVAPPNVNLVQMSTNNSVSLQTSDREMPATVDLPPVSGLVTAEEEEEQALLLLSSVGGSGHQNEQSALDGVGKSTGGEQVQTTATSKTTTTTTAATLDDESFVLLLSLETTTPSDSPVPQAPKKARLAKQDSVLSEFEATLAAPSIQAPIAMDTTAADDATTEHKPKYETSSSSNVIASATVSEETAKLKMMDDDAPELCADYDDDGSNLQISQENLFVDLGIAAVCDDGGGGGDEYTDRIGSVPGAPLKKDELQLLLEKSQKVDDQLEAAVEAQEDEPAMVGGGGGGGVVHHDITPAVAPPISSVRVRKSAISSSDDNDRQLPVPLPSIPIEGPSLQDLQTSPSSSSESIAPGGGSAATGSGAGVVRMVEVEIKDRVILSRSLDSVGGGDESDFESSSPFMSNAPSSFPNERSFSSESLNSETSIDSNDSKSSLKIIESKFAAKNGTLERQQQSNGNRESTGGELASSVPAGLQVLVLWNNEITRNSVRHFSRLLEKSHTLDTLNVGSNLLCNNFVAGIGAALKANGSLTNLGLQGAHLSDKGAKAMADIIEFGGNATLQRIDLRNNNIQKGGLEALNEAMKSNKSVTRIDLDDTPRRVKDTSLDGVGSEYSRLLNNIRAQCERNKNPPEPSEPISTTVKRARANYLSSRKISLTCPSIKTSPSAISGADKQHLLDPSGCKKTPPSAAGGGGGRLRSPLPSPIPSPIASPVPSPSRNRFHVSRVTDGPGIGGASATGSVSSPSPSSTGSSPTLFFPSNSRFRVVTVAEPDLKSANKHTGGSTVSLPTSGSKPSPSVSPLLSIASSGGGGGGGIGTSPFGPMSSSSMGGTIVHRRPVCSSAPTLSSFPSSPLSPLAAAAAATAVPTTMTVRPMAPSSPVPVVVPVPNNSPNTFNTATLPSSSTLVAPPAVMVPALVGCPTRLVNNPPMMMPPMQQQQQLSNVTPILPHTQRQFQPLLPPVASLLAQQPMAPPPGYHFIPAYGAANITPIATVQQQSTPHPPPPPMMMFHQIAKHPTATPQTTVQHQQLPHYTTPAYAPPSKVRHSSTPTQQQQQQQQHSSSSNSSTLHDSVLSSTSIESPDLEVKRFMVGGGGGRGVGGGGGVGGGIGISSGGVILDDSCCSSISSSSIDSIDNPHFVSTSISSTDDSFDLIVSSPLPAGSTCSSFSIVPSHTASSMVAMTTTTTTTTTMTPSVVESGCREEESTLIPPRSMTVCGGPKEGHPSASLSSSSIGGQLNTATSSQESLYDVHELSASSSSSVSVCPNGSNWIMQGGTTKPPVVPLSTVHHHHHHQQHQQQVASSAVGAKLASGNSNESTLTSVQSIEKEPVPPVKATTEKAPRVRKTSWILGGVAGVGVGSGGGSKHTDSSSSGGSTPTPSGGGGSGYPPAIEKLLSIFHNPSNLFSSSKASSSASPPPPPPGAASSAETGSSGGGTGSQPPSRKESPMGGLFHWAHGGGNSTSNNTSPTSGKKEDDQQRGAALMKVNVSPETTLTPQQLQPLQNQAQLMTQTLATGGLGQHHHHHHHQQQQQQSVEHMPPQLKVEMKENISPENTITHKLLTATVPAPVIVAPSGDTGPVSMPTAAVAHTKVIFQLGGDYDESEDDIETLTNKYGNNASLGGSQYHLAASSGPSSLLGGSTTSNSSGISIGSGTSACGGGSSSGMIMVPSPTPSTTSGGQGSASSDTVLVLSHLGQLARDSLSMFKNPSLTSQDSISVRSMDSLVEMAGVAEAGNATPAAVAPAGASIPTQSTPSSVPNHPSSEATAMVSFASAPLPPTSSPSSVDKPLAQ